MCVARDNIFRVVLLNFFFPILNNLINDNVIHNYISFIIETITNV